MIIPLEIRRRRNVDKSIMTDVMVISLLCWQIDFGMTIQTKFYRFLSENCFPIGYIPEESRFNRICNHDKGILTDIRLFLIFKYVHPKYSILDSFPMPECKYIRDGRAKLFEHNNAGFGYNSTKRVHYRGFKGHFEISDQGFVLAYETTNPAIHDVNIASDLLRRYSTRYVLADKGYISKKLHDYWAQYGVYIWTPKRRNMKQYKYNDRKLRRLRVELKQYFQSGI